MNWGLFPWRWFAAGVLSLTVFAAGFAAGQRRVERAWAVERFQQQAVALQQSLHVAQVQTQQERINQQILTDYETKKSLLARRSPVLRDSAHSLCIPASGVTSPVPITAEPAAHTDAIAAHAVPDPPGEPMFPSYVFVQLDTSDNIKGQSWSPIRSTLGVRDLVKFGGHPAKVDADLITALHEREQLQQSNPQALFSAGDKVVITDGPFAGIEAIYQTADAEQRSMILLTDAQSRVFAALWQKRNRAQSSEFIMRAAGLDSEKPMDVFKLKAANRGDPVYEGPLHAYEQLVSRQRRLGLYRLVWVEPSSL